MSADTGRMTNALADRYRIEREIGAGGMATVYLAHDIKHERRVALKVLKPELAVVLGADRFVIEIKTTAALQHPHILPLYDSGTADGFLFYVMPFIDGETLRAKLDRETQLGIDEAVRIATNIADALDYAHRHGVIHRDIKPENILLHEGRPMVADFGIALAVSAAAGGRMTETGLSLGTPHYMSPEQATAEKEISARSDIYSLASVLYEMLTGQPPHTGVSAQQIIMKIITEEPANVTSLRKSVPSNVAAALSQALEKLPADRFESAKAFALAVGDARFARFGGAEASAGKERQWKWRFYAAGIAAVVFAGVAAFAQVSGPRAASRTPSMHLRLEMEPGDRIAAIENDNLRNADRPSRTAFAFTPDGESLVYSGIRDGKQMLYLRPLGGETARPIEGTEGGESPFFSPDGATLGFWANEKLRRVSLAGGPPTDIAATPRISGASWGADGRIVVGSRDIGLIIHAVSNNTKPDSLIGPGAVLPQWLPGGEAILFTNDRRLDNNTQQIEVIELKSGRRTIVIEEGEDARYVPTGHLVYGKNGSMMGVTFNASRLEVGGNPVVVLDDVMQARNGMNVGVRTGAMQVAISPLGQLAWVTGGVTPDRIARVEWIDRQGRITPITAAGDGAFFMARLSPDQTKFALFSFGNPTRMVIVDVARGSRQVLPGPQTPWITWAPDNRHVVHTGTVRDSAALVWIRDDNSRPAEPFAGSARVQGYPLFWSYDGTELFTMRGDSLLAYSIPDGSSRAISDLPAEMYWPTLSPDGKWIAYATIETGATFADVFVQPWPALDRKWKISNGGGAASAWTRDGRELVYLKTLPDSAPGTMTAFSVDIGTAPEFSHGEPRELFTAVFGQGSPGRTWDITADGSRFLNVVGRTPNLPPGDIHVMVNWFPQLQRLLGDAAARR